MSALWRALRQEVVASIDEIKQKGAVGALRDAALDAVDIVKETGGYVAGTSLNLEVAATIDDFKEKGAAGMFRDAALDAVDIFKETGGYVAGKTADLIVVQELRKELHETVVDVREKGAVQVLKNATMEAVDLVHEGASTATNEAQKVASKAIAFMSVQEEVPDDSLVKAIAFSNFQEEAPDDNLDLEDMYDNFLMDEEAQRVAS
jgi:hypothetical protein